MKKCTVLWLSIFLATNLMAQTVEEKNAIQAYCKKVQTILQQDDVDAWLKLTDSLKLKDAFIQEYQIRHQSADNILPERYRAKEQELYIDYLYKGIQAEQFSKFTKLKGYTNYYELDENEKLQLYDWNNIIYKNIELLPDEYENERNEDKSFHFFNGFVEWYDVILKKSFVTKINIAIIKNNEVLFVKFGRLEPLIHSAFREYIANQSKEEYAEAVETVDDVAEVVKDAAEEAVAEADEVAINQAKYNTYTATLNGKACQLTIHYQESAGGSIVYHLGALLYDNRGTDGLEINVLDANGISFMDAITQGVFVLQYYTDGLKGKWISYDGNDVKEVDFKLL